MSPDDAPRSMRDADVRSRRRSMLDLPHVLPLTAFAARLREFPAGEVPDFDPLDGGVKARALFLYEKPGPMTAERGKREGSGFVSRDNDDATAEATFHFMREAAIHRRLTVIWNVIPWWNGTVTVTGDEIRKGAACVVDLIRLLPELRAVVMVGRRAAAAQQYLKTTGLHLLASDHPSPRVRARWPNRWRAIPSRWAEVLTYIDSGEEAGSITRRPQRDDPPRR